MSTKVYRPGPLPYVLGAILILGPAAFSWWMYRQYIHHIPMLISNGRYSHGSHWATDDEKLFWINITLCMIPFGILLVVMAVNSRILVEPEGIVLINGFRREVFRAEWHEITGLLTRKRAKGGVNYILCAGTRHYRLGVGANDELLAEIRSRVPGLVEGDADSGPTRLP